MEDVRRRVKTERELKPVTDHEKNLRGQSKVTIHYKCSFCLKKEHLKNLFDLGFTILELPKSNLYERCFEY